MSDLDCSQFCIKHVSSLTDFNEKLRRIIVIRTICIEYHIHYQYLKRYTEPNCDYTLTDTEVSTYPGHTVIRVRLIIVFHWSMTYYHIRDRYFFAE